MKKILSGACAILTLTACTASLTNQVPVHAPTNNLVSIRGADEHVPLVANLAEAFTKNHADAQMSVTGGGSATGIAALLRGEIAVADSVRELSADERRSAQQNSRMLQEFIVARTRNTHEPIYQYVTGVPRTDSTLGQFLQFEASTEARHIIQESGYELPTSEDETRNQELVSSMQ